MNITPIQISLVALALIVLYYAIQGFIYRRKARKIEKQLLASNTGLKQSKNDIIREITGIRTDIENSGLVYWGKIDGHRLYYWSSIDHIQAWRLAAIKLGYEKLGFGMTDEGFDAWLDSTEANFDSGKLSAVGASFKFIRGYKSNWGSYDTLMHIAGCGVLVDSEPIGDFSVRHNKIKEKLLRDNQDVRAFFLNTSADYLLKLNPDSTILEVKDYWMSPQGQRMASTLWKVTQIKRFENLWQSLTTKSYGWQKELVSLARSIYFQKPSQNTM